MEKLLTRNWEKLQAGHHLWLHTQMLSNVCSVVPLPESKEREVILLWQSRDIPGHWSNTLANLSFKLTCMCKGDLTTTELRGICSFKPLHVNQCYYHLLLLLMAQLMANARREKWNFIS